MNEHESLQHLMHSLAMQKQTVQQQQMEAELALKELSTAKNAYRIVGGLMLHTDVDTLKHELTTKRDTANARLTSIDRQLDSLKTKIAK